MSSDELLMAQALEAIEKLKGQVSALNTYIDTLEAQAGISKSRRPRQGSILPVPVGQGPATPYRDRRAEEALSKSLAARVEKRKTS